MTDNLINTFKKLKKILSQYQPPLVAKNDYQSRYELVFNKPLETKSKRTGNIIKKNELYFAAIIIQSNYVGFYFMPIYSHRKEFSGLSPDTMKLLKGKSCFHIKILDKNLLSEIKKMVAKGFIIYSKL